MDRGEDPSPVATDLIAQVSELGKLVRKYGGNMSGFVYSPDEIDRWGALNLRTRAAGIAKEAAKLSDDDAERVTAAMVRACAGDEYAEKEIAGRFANAILRCRMIARIESKGLTQKFWSLVNAVERGRATKKQMAFAARLAA